MVYGSIVWNVITAGQSYFATLLPYFGTLLWIKKEWTFKNDILSTFTHHHTILNLYECKAQKESFKDKIKKKEISQYNSTFPEYLADSSDSTSTQWPKFNSLASVCIWSIQSVG